jgi:hypothetical protein
MTTALDIIKSAMRKSGVLTMGENPSSSEAQDALEALNDLLSSWSNDSMIVYARTFDNFTLSSGIPSYTIGSGGTFNTVRPVRIVSAYVRSGDIDYQLQIMTEENYDSVTFKGNASIPAFLAYSNGYPLGQITLYPTPATSDTIYLRTEKPLTEFTSTNTTVDLPPGWKRALIHNLAIELAAEYGQQVAAEVVEIARESKGEIRRAIMAAKPMQWEEGPGRVENIYTGWFG